MYHPVSLFVTPIVRARNSVFEGRGRAVNTAQGGIAGFSSIAEETVITAIISTLMDHPIVDLITAIEGARDLIINVWRDAGLAIPQRVASLNTVAEQPIVTLLVIGCVPDCLRHFATAIDRTANAVVDDGSLAWLTAIVGIADLNTIAE